ncbi:DUF3109 family protein [Namhaeicola litoreus]|uniref:DUF3109 family protein n=1 Tax=Namhaeicola litoreus TaxID=1052145 RepID=A0ABW3XZP7_9FLAO
MFQIDKTLVSEDVIEKQFLCNLSACKGACCIHGEAGAPIEKDERKILERIYPTVKPLLRKQGQDTIEKHGTYIQNDEGDFETPLIEGGECAYVIFDHKNIALCGIEQAFNKGLIDFKKPISCHLYPVRIQAFSEFSAVNYSHWDICNDACALGKSMELPVYKFLKEALIRKFGADWYEELELVAEQYYLNK